MFNLNENNRIVMAQHPSDMRIGVNGMCGQVRSVGLDPTNGDVYIFVSFTAKLFNRSLVLKATPKMWFEKLTGLYSDHIEYLNVTFNATYYISNVYFSAYYSSAHRALVQYSLDAISIKHRPIYQFKIGWSNGKWNLSASAVNIFRRDWITSTSSLNSRWFDQYSTDYSANSHQFVSLTASYTFGFGKKVKRGDEVQTMDAGGSAIMK